MLLIFCGVNVPLDKLPDWMHAIGEGLPMTHAIEAARQVADGASLASVGPEMLAEIGLGSVYLVVGLRSCACSSTGPAARHTGSRMRLCA